MEFPVSTSAASTSRDSGLIVHCTLTFSVLQTGHLPIPQSGHDSIMIPIPAFPQAHYLGVLG